MTHCEGLFELLACQVNRLLRIRDDGSRAKEFMRDPLEVLIGYWYPGLAQAVRIPFAIRLKGINFRRDDRRGRKTFEILNPA